MVRYLDYWAAGHATGGCRAASHARSVRPAASDLQPFSRLRLIYPFPAGSPTPLRYALSFRRFPPYSQYWLNRKSQGHAERIARIVVVAVAVVVDITEVGAVPGISRSKPPGDA